MRLRRIEGDVNEEERARGGGRRDLRGVRAQVEVVCCGGLGFERGERGQGEREDVVGGYGEGNGWGRRGVRKHVECIVREPLISRGYWWRWVFGCCESKVHKPMRWRLGGVSRAKTLALCEQGGGFGTDFYLTPIL